MQRDREQNQHLIEKEGRLVRIKLKWFQMFLCMKKKKQYLVMSRLQMLCTTHGKASYWFSRQYAKREKKSFFDHNFIRLKQ